MESAEFKFYMVWCPKGGMPSVRHATKDIARDEARRLSLCNQGEPFYVLAAFERYESTQPITVTSLHDMPAF